MGRGMYTAGMQEIMAGNIDLVNDSLLAVAVSPEYTPDLSADQVQTDIPTASQLGECFLSGLSLDGTTLRADPVTFPALAGTVGGVVIVHDTDNLDTSSLLAYIDSTSFPVAVTGPLTIEWDTQAGVFTL